jgi:hypothetical protein
MTDYGDLSTTELAKQINADYDLILEAERTALQRYLAMGEKLIALRPRIAPKHGEWQAKLKLHCPQVSYETANLCIRFVENFDKLEAYAATKNVKVTDLGIDEARKALAKPKSNTDKTSKDKPAGVVKAAVEPANEPNDRRDEDIAKQYLAEVWDASELVDVLRQVRDIDYLMELATAVAKVLTPTPTPTQPSVSSAGVGLRRA